MGEDIGWVSLRTTEPSSRLRAAPSASFLPLFKSQRPSSELVTKYTQTDKMKSLMPQPWDNSTGAQEARTEQGHCHRQMEQASRSETSGLNTDRRRRRLTCGFPGLRFPVPRDGGSWRGRGKQLEAAHLERGPEAGATGRRAAAGSSKLRQHVLPAGLLGAPGRGLASVGIKNNWRLDSPGQSPPRTKPGRLKYRASFSSFCKTKSSLACTAEAKLELVPQTGEMTAPRFPATPETLMLCLSTGRSKQPRPPPRGSCFTKT